MNIFSLIKKDHDNARTLMNRILDTRQAQPRLALFEELKTAILSHAKSEEKTFYKALKNEVEDWAEEVPHLTAEHKDVEKLFAEIDKQSPESPLWWEKFGEVRNALLHHMEEEEKEIFKDAKKEIHVAEGKELGEEMEELEEKAKARLEAAA